MSGAVQTAGPVTFDYAFFQRRFPEISEWCSPDQTEFYFELATSLLDNRDAGGTRPFCTALQNSPITDIPTRQRLLGLLTAHIATLFAPINGVASPTLVGRITNASEGSVSVGVDFPSDPGAEWFTQTKYGAMFWQLTKRYRQMRYYPGRQPSFDRWPFGQPSDGWNY